MGKNFSRNNVGGKRKESDLYETPYCLTEALLERECFGYNDELLEPCCGNGAIVHVLKNRGYQNVTAYDVTSGVDFLLEQRMFDVIVTNPPFSIANLFVLKAKQVCRKKFAMLLPLTYLQGSFRLNHVWNDVVFPLCYVYVLSRYPMLGLPLRDDGKITTGMQAYAWFVFDKSGIQEPVVRWINLDPFIVKK